MLQADGTLYTTPLRGARVTDHYVAKGGGMLRWFLTPKMLRALGE